MPNFTFRQVDIFLNFFDSNGGEGKKAIITAPRSVPFLYHFGINSTSRTEITDGGGGGGSVFFMKMKAGRNFSLNFNGAFHLNGGKKVEGKWKGDLAFNTLALRF